MRPNRRPSTSRRTRRQRACRSGHGRAPSSEPGFTLHGHAGRRTGVPGRCAAVGVGGGLPGELARDHRPAGYRLGGDVPLRRASGRSVLAPRSADPLSWWPRLRWQRSSRDIPSAANTPVPREGTGPPAAQLKGRIPNAANHSDPLTLDRTGGTDGSRAAVRGKGRATSHVAVRSRGGPRGVEGASVPCARSRHPARSRRYSHARANSVETLADVT